ncbi:hypothetical protein R1sor_004801 [Riccia sorocarpa]|uniref:Reverse transcriptase domain-containing protein n=1 Tax=Riccia sorocarpa TaxID=122646 RepID=A0ABD3HLH8_9MARC
MRSPHRRYSLRGFLHKEKPDFLMVQETHLEEKKLRFYLQTMTRDYNVIASSSTGRKRGVAIIYKNDLQLLEEKRDDQGRYVWGRFALGDRQVYLASVYAPNDCRDRIEFWKVLTRDFPKGQWMVGGDWNAVVSQEDSSTRANVQGEEEALAFQILCSALGVRDAREWAHKREGPKFTRTQNRGERLSWSRLDRVYTGSATVTFFKHHANYWLSDHIPATAKIQVNEGKGEEHKRYPPAYFKADYYVVEQNRQHLTDKWEESLRKFQDSPALEKFLCCWTELRREIKVLQYEKKVQLEAVPKKEKRIREILQVGVEDWDEDCQKEFAKLTEEVRELQAWENHRWRMTCREKFLREGEACSGYLFRRFKKRRKKTQVTKLKTEDGRLLHNQEVIKKEVHKNYEQLYDANFAGQNELEQRQNLLRGLSTRLTVDQNRLLEEVPTEAEIFGSLLLLPTGKSPGPDGMTVEILKSLWTTIGGLFYQAMIELWEKGELPAAYKEVMRVLGFSETFIRVVQALQMEAESRVLINGSLLPTFQVRRGVRQGCPLSPLLYIIATIPIIQKIKEENRTGAIKPVTLNGGLQVSSLCFADDMAFFVEPHQDSVERLFQFLNEVETASGGRVNWRKSKMLIVGSTRKFPRWTSNLGVQLVEATEVTRYLGAPLTTVWRGAENGELLLKSIKDKVSGFASPLLSFETRLLILKHWIFPVVTHQLMTTSFKKAMVKKFEKIFREFLWSQDPAGKLKKSLLSWEVLKLPMRRGGLGIFSFHEFQQAMFCRLILKALADPISSMWAPIFSVAFLGAPAENLVEAMCLRPIPKMARLSPLTNLFISAWYEFLSYFYWRSPGENPGGGSDLDSLFFLQARRVKGVSDASRMAANFTRWRKSLGLEATQILCTEVLQGAGGDAALTDEEWELLERVRDIRSIDADTGFRAEDWQMINGDKLKLNWRAADIYDIFISAKEGEHINRLNQKWDLNWLPWGIFDIKGLGHKHKVFLWRATTSAFYDGSRAKKIGWTGQEIACASCRAQEEDISHALWLCPRWEGFWSRLATRITECRGLSRLRSNQDVISQVVRWALDGGSSQRLFKCWLLALSWRLLWGERCTLKYQGETNTVSFERLVSLFLEELWAKKGLEKKKGWRLLGDL